MTQILAEADDSLEVCFNIYILNLQFNKIYMEKLYNKAWMSTITLWWIDAIINLIYGANPERIILKWKKIWIDYFQFVSLRWFTDKNIKESWMKIETLEVPRWNKWIWRILFGNEEKYLNQSHNLIKNNKDIISIDFI